MSRRLLLHVVPTPKPRMTRSDKWRTDPHDPDPKRRQRPCVTRYWAYCDLLRVEAAMNNFVPQEQGMALTFWVPMPRSWSKKKKAALNGTPHQQVPDLSNMLKAWEDALLEQDCRIWHYAGLEKRWGPVGCVEVVLEGSPALALAA